MRAYSQDLRDRVIAAIDAGQQSLSAIARTFGVSESTVDKWNQRRRETGRVAALPFAGGRRRALQPCAAQIRAAVKQQADVSLAELCERIAETTGVVASPSMMCRELQHCSCRKKKVAPRESTGHAAGEAPAQGVRPTARRYPAGHAGACEIHR